MTKHIDEATLAILSRVTIEGNAIFLTCGQLDKKQYQSVNEVIENIGGKWDRKTKSHLFTDDPTDNLEQVLLTGEITQPKKYGYFPTPPGLAQKIIDLAGIETDHLVLEPSAGQGHIAGWVPKSAVVHCIELLTVNAEELEKKGLKVIAYDFMLTQPEPVYDRIVMNPPFERQQDIDHVQHAWKFLKQKGRLVSIMSAGVLFRENKKTTEFRAMVEDYGTIERLPEGSFKESGTQVNTCLVVMNKP